MLRRLFACLALLTGLAVAGTPAQAHVADADRTRIEAGLGQLTASRVETAIARQVPQCRLPKGHADAERPLARVSVLNAPSVHVGSDRARE